MPLLGEHFRFGAIFGCPLYVALFAIAYHFGLFPDFYTSLVSLISGLIAVIVGSLLPDMDAPSSPIHDTLLVFFGILMAMAFQAFAPLAITMMVVPPLSVYIDRNHLPKHRGAIHTVWAGAVFGLLLSGGLYVFVIKNTIVCLWSGFGLFVGHILHLVKDRRFSI